LPCQRIPVLDTGLPCDPLVQLAHVSCYVLTDICTQGGYQGELWGTLGNFFLGNLRKTWGLSQSSPKFPISSQNNYQILPITDFIVFCSIHIYNIFHIAFLHNWRVMTIIFKLQWAIINYKTGFKSNIIIKSEKHYEKTQRTGFPSHHMLCLLPGDWGGARIHQVMEQIKVFKSSNESLIVDKICISVGTNDIRYADSLDKIKLKFKSWCALLKELYPSSKVYFQSLIPLPCKSRHDCKTKTFVMNMNSIIKNECIYRRFYILDAFRSFSMRFYDPRLPHIRDNRFFRAGDIHPREA
jgi:hypothetical protein